MVLAGTRGSVARFENDVTLAVPDVAWIASVPCADAAGTYGISEPLLDTRAAGCQGTGAQGRGGPTVGYPGKSGNVLVVGTADVPAGFSHLGQINAVRGRLDLAGLEVGALKRWSSHGPWRIICAFEWRRRGVGRQQGGGGTVAAFQDFVLRCRSAAAGVVAGPRRRRGGGVGAGSAAAGERRSAGKGLGGAGLLQTRRGARGGGSTGPRRRGAHRVPPGGGGGRAALPGELGLGRSLGERRGRRRREESGLVGDTVVTRVEPPRFQIPASC